MNLRPLGYEPNELPDCSTPHSHRSVRYTIGQTPVPTGKRRLVAWFIRQELARSMAVSPKIPFRPCLMRAGSRREGWRRSRVSGEDNPSIPTASSWSRADPVGWHYPPKTQFLRLPLVSSRLFGLIVSASHDDQQPEQQCQRGANYANHTRSHKHFLSGFLIVPLHVLDERNQIADQMSQHRTHGHRE